MAKFFTPTKLSENIRETPEGFLLCLNVQICRTGWQEYGPGETPIEVGPDGIVNIYRDAKEVFRPQTIASFQAKSFTVKHPEEFVKPENWKELTYGTIQNVRRSDERDEDGNECLLADILVTDEIAIGLIHQGLREVSCGYEAEYEETGEGEGRQFNIIGNHVALVEEGRAGSSYAINDHKGKVNDMGNILKDLADQLKKIGKTVDEAASAEEKKSKKTKDESVTPTASQRVEGDVVTDEDAYDALVKGVKDLSDKIDAMSKKSGDEEAPKKKKDDAEDEDEEESEDADENSMEDRMKALEAAVAKLLKTGDADEEESEDDDMSEEDMSGDEDMEEESEDASEEGEEGEKSQKKMGDAARIEILVPGFKAKGKDARAQVLKAFAKTADGKKVLETLGLKKLTLDSKSSVDMTFMAASTIMKAKRGTGLENTKNGSAFTVGDSKSEPMSAEKMNEINAAHWKK